MELEKIVMKFPIDDVYTAKKHISSDIIIGATRKNIVIYDKDLREVSRSDTYDGAKSYGIVLNILDENLVHYNLNSYPQTDLGAVIDIRTMKPLHTEVKLVVRKKFNFFNYLTVPQAYNSNGAYRTIAADKGVGTIWNLKTNTWETTFTLPNYALNNPICNSRYAVLSSNLEPKYSNMVVLDFDSIAKQ